MLILSIAFTITSLVMMCERKKIPEYASVEDVVISFNKKYYGR